MNYRRTELTGILLCVIALFIFFSFATYDSFETPSGLSPEVAHNNFMGVFGIYISHYIMKLTFGFGAFSIPIVIGLIGYTLFTRNNMKSSIRYSTYIIGFGIWLSLFISSNFFRLS